MKYRMSNAGIQSFYLVGSNDGVTWYQVDSQALSSSSQTTFSVSGSPAYYSVYRLIASKTFAGTNAFFVNLTINGNFQYYNNYSLDSTGRTGASGITGTTGVSGVSGVSGWTGPSGTGWTGATGFSAASGVSGISGVSGRTGIPGASSVTGSSYVYGSIGTIGVDGVQGVFGQSGFTGATGIFGSNGAVGYTGETGYTGCSGSTGVTGSSGTSGITGGTGVSGCTGAQGVDGRIGFTGIVGYIGDIGHTGAAGAYDWGPEWRPLTLDFVDNTTLTRPTFSYTMPAGWMQDGAGILAHLEGGLPRTELVYSLDFGSDVGSGGNDMVMALAHDNSGNIGFARSMNGIQYTYPFSGISNSNGTIPYTILWDGLKWIRTPRMAFSYDGIAFTDISENYGIVSIAIGGRRIGSSDNGDGKSIYIGLGAAGIYQSFDGIYWYLVSSVLTASVGGRVIWDGVGWVATGVQGIARGSADGLTWSLVASGIFDGSGGGLDLVYSGETWLAVGAAATVGVGNVMARSVDDGYTWYAVDISYALFTNGSAVFGAGHEMSLEWNGKVFVLCVGSSIGNVGPIWTSSNGLQWTVVPGPFNGSSPTVNSLHWNGLRFLGAGTVGGNSMIVRGLAHMSSYAQIPASIAMATNAPSITSIIDLDFSSARSLHNVRFPFSQCLAFGQDASGAVIGRSLDEGFTWTWSHVSGIFGSGAVVRCVVWNGQRWVAGATGMSLGSGSTMATSMDGVVWVASGSRLLDVGVTALEWSTEQHVWVAGGTSSTLSSGLVYSVSALGQLWIPCSWTSGTYLTSVNAVTWDRVAKLWCAVAFGSGSGTGLAISSNGKSWAVVGTVVGGIVETGITVVQYTTAACWTGSEWVLGAVDASGVSVLVTGSSDGSIWSIAQRFVDGNNANNVITSLFVDSDSSVWIAVTSSGVWTRNSVDGWAWTAAVGLPPGANSAGGSVVGWNEASFIYGDLSGNVALSPNGELWSAVSVYDSGLAVRGFAWNHPRIGHSFLQTPIVAGGVGTDSVGQIGYSYDGVQWFATGSNAGLTSGVAAIAYGGTGGRGYWVAVGSGTGWLATSFDGRIWKGPTDGAVSRLMTSGVDVQWNGSVFLAAGVGSTGAGILAASGNGGVLWNSVTCVSAFGGTNPTVVSLTWTGAVWLALVSGSNAGTTFVTSAADGLSGWSVVGVSQCIVDASSVVLAACGGSGYFTSTGSGVAGVDISASFVSIGHEPYYAVDGLYLPSNGYWNTSAGYDVSSGLYVGGGGGASSASSWTASLAGSSTGSVSGDWLQLDVSGGVTGLCSYYVAVNLNSASSVPSAWTVLGLDLSGNWTRLDAFDWTSAGLVGVPPASSSPGGKMIVPRTFAISARGLHFQAVRLVVASIFGTGTGSGVMSGSVVEWDIHAANSGTSVIPAGTRAVVHSSGLVLVCNGAYRGSSGTRQWLLTAEGTSGDAIGTSVDGFVGNGLVVGGAVGAIQSGCGLSGALVGGAFDGTRFTILGSDGSLVYSLVESRGMPWTGGQTVGLNGSGSAICSIGGRICVGNVTGTVRYNTLDSGDVVWKASTNSLYLFAGGIGALCSNDTVGTVYSPNTMWMMHQILFRIMGPRWYDSSAETVNMSLQWTPFSHFIPNYS